MPSKRYVRRTVDFLDRHEMNALLKVPDRSTWIGRRDHLILLTALQTGLRASELINLRRQDVVLGASAHVRCEGKGRRQRRTPLRREPAEMLELWFKKSPNDDSYPLFPTTRGNKMSRDALERIVRKYALAASTTCGSLVGKTVTPHVLRHYVASRTM